MANWKLMTILVAALGVTNAAAATDPTKGGQHERRQVSIEELRDRCVNSRSGKYGDQLPPEGIRLQCYDSYVFWAAAEPGEMALPAERVVTASVYSTKYLAPAERAVVPVTSKPGTCHRFVEIERTFSLERELQCAELVKLSDLASYCTGQLNGSKGKDPKAVQSRYTGRVIDTCGGGGLQSN